MRPIVIVGGRRSESGAACAADETDPTINREVIHLGIRVSIGPKGPRSSRVSVFSFHVNMEVLSLFGGAIAIKCREVLLSRGVKRSD